MGNVVSAVALLIPARRSMLGIVSHLIFLNPGHVHTMHSRILIPGTHSGRVTLTRRPDVTLWTKKRCSLELAKSLVLHGREAAITGAMLP